MAPTDSEDRQVAAEGLPSESELEIVAFPDDPAELRVRPLAEESRVYVRSPGQDEGRHTVEERRGVLGPAGGEDGGEAGRGPDRPHVRLSQDVNAGPPVVGACRDADGRAHHMRSGTGMPRTSSRASIWRTKAVTRSVRKARRSSVSA